MSLTVLLLEPYHSGSHAAWAEGYAAHSRHRVELLTLPGRFWKWRMHGAAVTLARAFLASDLRPDLVLASDMLDLATFLGLARTRLAGIPVAAYFHENQLAYPAQSGDPAWDASRRRRTASSTRDMHYPFINFTTALAADQVFWNSAYNRDSFIDALPGLLKHFPDYNELDSIETIRANSEILPLGLDLSSLDAAKSPRPRQGPPLILWNHRWEYDKGPADFFAALSELVKRGLNFEVALLGESFRNKPREFLEARDWLGPRIIQFGYTKNRQDYARWLWQSDIVVSAARHEFFGISVAEAMHCGCWPILPRRLVYPDLLPPAWHSDCLYDDLPGLTERLAWAIEHIDHVRQRNPRPIVERYDWAQMGPVYDKKFRMQSSECRVQSLASTSGF